MLYGIILVKSVQIYDKLKQTVAINNVYNQIIKDEGEKMREMFKNEDEVQDLITRKIMEQNRFISDEEHLTEGHKLTPNHRKSTQM